MSHQSRVFISYRRSDSSGHAGRIYDHLSMVLGRDNVFMDVEGIGGGDDFVDALDRAISSCTACVPVIGPTWVDVKDEQGRRRLDDPGDFVRREVSAALTRDIKVIPALVGGAAMPAEDDLPDELKSLTRRNAIQLSDTRWDYDTGLLQQAITGAKASRSSTFKVLGAGAAILVVLALVLAAVFKSEFQNREAAGPKHDAERRIVVLPFKNLGNPDDEYFAAGMTEELRSRLASVPGLVTISGHSSAQVASRGCTSAEIANELDVSHIVTGTFRWSHSAEGGVRIRFNPGLVDADTDAELWSDVIDTTIEDVFEAQSRIASQVVSQLGITLFSNDDFQRTSTHNLNAYEQYLQGAYQARPTDWSAESLHGAIESFQAAVEIDPEFVQAWSGLARANAALHILGYDTSPQRCADALAAVKRAERINSSHRSTALAAGYYHYWCELDYASALEALEKPELEYRNDDEVLSLLSHLQRRQGHWQESLRNRKSAARLDPKNLSYLRNIATTETYMRLYEDAIATCDKLQALQPDQRAAYAIKANNLWLSQGKAGLEMARAELDHTPNAVLDWWQQLIFEGKSCEAAELAAGSDKKWQRIGANAYPKEYLEARALEICGDQRSTDRYEAAQAVVEREIDAAEGEDYRLLSILGRILARAGEKDAAIQAAERSAELLPVEHDSLWGSTLLLNLAEVYTVTGETNRALDTIATVLAQPAWFSVKMLELDPTWAPLRDSERFETILSTSAEQ